MTIHSLPMCSCYMMTFSARTAGMNTPAMTTDSRANSRPRTRRTRRPAAPMNNAYKPDVTAIDVNANRRLDCLGVRVQSQPPATNLS